ncbi:MAG TPA: DUF423 domain-containing protein [Steroidobacteraceae bacterium]|jgi:uncharacterized membrane protein YgdD (TMEM256/DUF423 family)
MLAALLLALATAIGALSAHAFRARLTTDRYDVLQTAVHYQFYHGLGLMGLGLLCDRLSLPWLSAAGWLVFAGVTLFSGSLYLLLAGAPRLVGVLTPLGGAALIVGWCVCAVSLWRQRSR